MNSSYPLPKDISVINIINAQKLTHQALLKIQYSDILNAIELLEKARELLTVKDIK